MRTFKPLWHEGLILTPQHFQQQEQWLALTQRRMTALTIAEAWGVVEVQIDEETLEAGRLQLMRLKLGLPDGAQVDTTPPTSSRVLATSSATSPRRCKACPCWPRYRC
jgi:type VI secretion system protein ImpJ